MSFPSASTLVLAGPYDLAACTALRMELMQAGEAAVGGPVHLDMSGVESGDIGFVQLLLAFEVSLKAAGRELTATASQAVRTLFERSGASLPGLA